MTDPVARKTAVSFRMDDDLLAQVDARIEQVNERKERDGEKLITRTDWFVNMAKWVVDVLPHQAVRSDLIDAWPLLPEEALGVKPSTTRTFSTKEKV